MHSLITKVPSSYATDQALCYAVYMSSGSPHLDSTTRSHRQHNPGDGRGGHPALSVDITVSAADGGALTSGDGQRTIIQRNSRALRSAILP